jgi:hypothetical protein
VGTIQELALTTTGDSFTNAICCQQLPAFPIAFKCSDHIITAPIPLLEIIVSCRWSIFINSNHRVSFSISHRNVRRVVRNAIARTSNMSLWP